MLPAVRDWLAWNEPNNPVFLTPQYKRVGAQLGDRRARSTTRRSATRSTTACTRRSSPSERVACGGTAPRGNNNPTSCAAVRLAARVPPGGRSGGLVTFDAWAHHPYYADPVRDADEQPHRRTARRRRRSTLGNIDDADHAGDAALRQQADLDHRVRLPDEPARPDLRRLVGEAGDLPHAGVRDRAARTRGST